MKKRAKPVSIAMLKWRNFLIIFVFTAAALCLSIYFLTACRVKTVTVENTSVVPQPLILDAANIKLGRHLYALSEEKIADTVIQSSPYIKSVTMKRQLPSTLCLFIEEYKISYYIEYQNEYYLLSDELFVLEKTDLETAQEKATSFLTLPQIKEPKKPEDESEPFEKIPSRSTLSFETKTDLAWSLKLLEALAKTDFSDQITEIDISDPFNLQIIVSDKYTILLGNEKNFEKKLTRCEHAIHYLTENMYGVTGILYATEDSPISFEIVGVIESS